MARRPSAIFLPSGWTWVDGCEDDPKRAFLVNAAAPEAAAKAAALLNAALVFYSTRTMSLAAKAGPMMSCGPPGSSGFTGPRSWKGEQRVAAAWPASLLLRTTYVYGARAPREEFYLSIAEKF